jgi:hypothetical protein
MIILLEVVLLNARPIPVARVASAVGAVAAAALFGLGAVPRRATATLVFVVALSFAVYVVITRALRSDHVIANLFFTASAPLAIFTPMMPGCGVWPTQGNAAVMTAVGLVALWDLDRACHTAPSWVNVTACFIEPFGAVVSIALVANVSPSTLNFAAAAIVAVLLTVWRGDDAFGARCAEAHIDRNQPAS